MAALTHHPAEYPRRILLAVTGLSPQVVTETLYGLCVIQQPAFVPTEVHLLTTGEGCERALLSLLDPTQGQFHAFCRDYRLEGCIDFRKESIHVLCDRHNNPLPDIRTPEENSLTADAITTLVRDLTQDNQAALHVSLAGGRKTMGFYLGYALSLFARQQDRLSHVLVSPPFESLVEFYYPPAIPRVLHTRENKPIHTGDAHVTLANIPFVRLRDGLPDPLLRGDATFSHTVAIAQACLSPPQLYVDVVRRELRCGTLPVKLPPMQLSWYAWMAYRRKHALEFGGHIRYTDAVALEFLDIYRQVVSEDSADYEQLAAVLTEEGLSEDFFNERKSRVNKALNTQLGSQVAKPYLIGASGKRPHTRFGLTLGTEQIDLRMPQ